MLAWDGCVNVRDLGGLPTADGRHTRFRVVVRADSIRTLTETGWAALADYGVRVAIDLRGDHERDEDPPGELPIRVIRIPVSPHEVPAATAWPSMSEAYLGLLERFPSEFARVAAAVAAEPAPMVIHCSGGRDRTGLAVALLLRLAGVDAETTAADHALSDDSWGPHNEDWFARAASEDERERRRRIAVPAGRTMARILEQVDQRYGGPERYLCEGGASEAALARVRSRLRD